jgi:hypothetical protein
MTPASGQESALYIERLHNRYLVADKAPEEVRARCEAALATTLPGALAIVLQQSLPADAPDVWFVRQLDVNLSLDPEIEHARVADLWAREIARSLVEAIQSEAPEVLHFPDRASYLAHFLVDVADGSAWDRWYYSEFFGMRMLSTSAALRTAIGNSPETGLRALHLLSHDQLRSILKSLNINDARRVLSSLAYGAGTATESECVPLIVDAWNAGGKSQFPDVERLSLLLFIRVTQERPDLAGEGLRAMAVAACCLANSLHDRSEQKSELFTALRTGEVSALYTILGVAAESLLPLVHCSADALESLMHRVSEKPVVDSRTRDEIRFTAFGGVFLLFPILEEFPFHAATSGWPDLGNTSPTVIIRSLVLAKCFGKDRFLGCLRDPLVRDLLQIPPEVSAPEIVEWLRKTPPDCLLSCLRANAAWHVETGVSDAESWVLARVAHKGAPVTLLLDAASEIWFFAHRRRNRTEGLPLQQLDLPQPKELICHESLWQVGRDCFPDCQQHPPLTGESSPLSSETHLVHDLRYLETPRELAMPRFADLCLSVAAQGVLRRFARKLPGFTKSSLGYLNHNFLDGCATVEESERQRIVSLSRPPLHLMISKAGLNRCLYRLSWLDGRPFAVFPEG